jgi:hypothetical protein
LAFTLAPLENFEEENDVEEKEVVTTRKLIYFHG